MHTCCRGLTAMVVALASSAAQAATTPLSEQGPFVDLGRVRDWGPIHYPPDAVHLAGDVLIYREGAGWRCRTPNAAPRDVVTSGRYALSNALVTGGANWLVGEESRRLRVVPVDCAGTPAATFVTPANYLGAYEGVVAASTAADGTLVVATNERVLQVHPVEGGPSVLFTLLDFQQQFLSEAEREAVAQGAWGVNVADVLALPSGDTWFVVQAPNGMGYQGVWIVRRDGAGVLSAVDVHRPGLTKASTRLRPRGVHSFVRDALLYDPARDLVFWQAQLNYPTDQEGQWLPSLVVTNAKGPPRPQRIALDEGPLALVTSTGEGVWVFAPSEAGDGTSRRWAPVDFGGATDVDGDRLSFAAETELGTDDLALDSDGDGVWDPLEVDRFHTDPARADSAPGLPPTTTTRFAFSSRLSEWPVEFPKRLFDTGVFRPDLAAGRAYCRGVTPDNCGGLECTGFKDYSCYDAEGQRLGDGPLLRWPSFGPGAVDWWTGTADALTYTRDGVTNEVGDASACTGLRCAQVWPVAPGVAFGPGPSAGGTTGLRRYTPSGWSEVCTPEGCGPRFLGHDEATGEAYVAVRATHREFVYAVAPTGEVSFLLDAWWLDAAGLRAMRGDGGALLVEEWHRSLMRPKVSVRDGTLRLLGARSLPVAPDGPRFRLGFDHRGQLGFMHAPALGAASDNCPRWAPPEVCSPPPGARRLPFPVFVDIFGELVAVDDRLRAGDVVFWVTTLMLNDPVDAGAWGGLWVHRESGATDPWFGWDTWERLGDEATRASIAQAPIRGVRQLSFSDDRARLCVATDDGRLFEWQLDDDLPASVRLLAPAEVQGCAYAADGALVVLEGAGLRLPSGVVSIGDAPGASGRQLVRAGERWLVRVQTTANGRTSTHVQCRDAGGGELGRVADVAGLTVEDGVVYWVTALDLMDGGTALPKEQQGVGHAALLDDFCAGRRAERLSLDEEPTPGTLIHQMYELMLFAGDGYKVLDVALARRPDGLLLVTGVGSDSPERGGTDATGKFLWDFLWRLYPAYRPVEGQVEAHAPWRRAAQVQMLVHPSAAGVTAMARAPGATPPDYGESTRYECLGHPCVAWTAPVDPPDDDPPPGPSTPPPGEVPASPPGCAGCGTAPGALGFVALLLLLPRRRSGADSGADRR